MTVIAKGTIRIAQPPPSAPSGAIFAIAAHPSCCASDASHLVQCGNGDAIRWWKDLVSGTWYEQATSGLRPILRFDGVYGWYSESDSTGRRLVLSLGSTLTGPFTIGMRYKVNTGYAGKYSIVLGSSGLSSCGPWEPNISPLLGVRGLQTNTSWLAYNLLAADNDYSTDIGQGETGLQGRFYGDGVEYTYYRSTPASQPTWGNNVILHGGYLDSDNFTSDSRIWRAAIYGSVLDATGRSSLTTWLEKINL